MILIPKHRDIIVPVKAPARVHAGFYKLEAVRADGSRRLLADWFPNLITNLGADQLGNSTPLSRCAVGSGNTPPSVSDTTLQALVSSTNLTNFVNRTAQPSSPYFGTTATQFNFPIGTATGNLSEVGVGVDATHLFSRALILDGFGSPTTITVLSSEALYVTYQLNVYVPLADVTGSVTIAGVPYAYTLRAASANSVQWAYFNGDNGGIEAANCYDGAIGAITSTPAGATSVATAINNDPYSTGSHQFTSTVTFGLTAGNFGGGIQSVRTVWGTSIGSRGLYQVQFTPNIPKDASHVLTLSFSSGWTINSP